MIKTLRQISIAVVGDAGVGKSCVIQSFLNSVFIPMYSPTSCNKYECIYQLKSGPSILLTIWDTSGLPDFDAIRPACYSGIDLFIICFARSDPSSMKNAMVKWLPEITAHVGEKRVLFLGTKKDLIVDKDAGMPLIFLPAIQGSRIHYYAECSAMQEYGNCLKSHIEERIKEIVDERHEKPKTPLKRLMACRCNLL